MSEVWKDAVGFEGSYEVSNLGNVRSVARSVMVVQSRRTYNKSLKSQIMRPKTNRQGYHCICLTVDAQKSHAAVHRLVAEAFIENPLNKAQVNHKNGDRKDNRVENLEWVTQHENMQHATVVLNRHGERMGNAKIRNADIVDIRSLLGWGVRIVDVARLYGVGKCCINDIDKGRSWKRVA